MLTAFASMSAAATCTKDVEISASNAHHASCKILHSMA